ncbi:MAG: hypothetical protein FJY29_00010 [Betaproteobacteria bacterium]|nr:hypothetical protein [Betaproteobacteria bacterium]
MNQRSVAFLYIALFLNLSACAPGSNADQVSLTASASSGLPIIGSWSPESYVGYSYTAMNERENAILEVERLRSEDWQIESNIDSSGNGYLKTKISCKPNSEALEKKVAGIPSPRSLGLFPDAGKLRICDSGKPIEHHQNHTVLAISRTAVPRNLGVDGKPQSLLESCSRLRGHRFIRHHTAFNARLGSTGCIGFADSAATRLSMLLVPMGEIHAVRIDFKRIR